jgi:glycosyltransferase involved in cell wall biosynthesis
MKIAHIAPPWIAIPPKNYGGTEIVIYNLVEEQVAQGHDVTLFAPGDARTSAKQVSFFPKSMIEEGIPWAAHLKAFYHMYKSFEQIKASDFDIVHTHLSSSSDMYIFPLSAHLVTPHVTTLHSCFPFDRVREWTGEADKYYMEWAPLVPVVAISESAMEAVPYDLNFVGVVHHGVPMETFRPLDVQRGDFFVWLGRFMPEKGPHLAIEAARKAGVPLTLAGIVDPHLPESINYFEESIKPHIDGDQVKYIGPVNMEQKIGLLSQARGFLNPIDWNEPFGMVMIESMALGCPVISFPRGAAPEIVVHRKTGFLVHDVEEMAQFIPRIEEINPEDTRTYVEKNFSVRAMANKYTRVYKRVIARSKEAGVHKYEEKRQGKPIITSSPAVAPPSVPDYIKTILPVQVPYLRGQVARAKMKVEPGP